MSESLSEKIAGILSAAPVSFDPEDDVQEETSARVVFDKVDDGESDEDVNLANFRKQNVDLLEDVDKRYEGKTSSRKNLLDSNDWQSEDEDSLDDFEETKAESDDEEIDNIDEEAESDSSTNGSVDDDDNVDIDDENDEHDEQFKHLKDSDVSDQIKKGMCVRQQLSMWESFLEIRIQMQKCLLTANKLPQTSVFNDLKDKCGLQYSSKVAESKNYVKGLLNKLLLLQTLLLKKHPETKKLFSGENPVTEDKIKSESDDEIPSDTEDEQAAESSEDAVEQIPRKKRKASDYSIEIGNRHKKYKDYRNSVIQKWNDKTRIAVSKSGNMVHSVTNQIEHILSDKEKLIKRTQLKRVEYEIVGHKTEDHVESQTSNNHQSPEEHDANIFDDSDFYHHLLRELIEFKSADLTDPVQLSRQWIQLQNLRSKMKRKIDTKATKGRKIRYVVHSKLVNFMAPIEGSRWQEEAKSELYGSLFGKNQPIHSV